MGLNSPAQLTAKKISATSPRSWWASLGEVFSLGYISLIVFFMACFIFENLLEADTVTIEELVLVFFVLVASLFVWCYQQSKRSKIHKKQLHAQVVQEHCSVTENQEQICPSTLSHQTSTGEGLDGVHACPATKAGSIIQRATKDDDHACVDLEPSDVQPHPDKQQPHTLDPLTCSSKQHLSQAFLMRHHNFHEFDVAQPALVDTRSLESVIQMPLARKQSESSISTETLGDFVILADEVPAYVTLQQSRWYGPQSPIDKIPSMPLQHDEKLLLGSEVIIGDIQNVVKRMHSFGPKFPADKEPSSPQMREDKIVPKVSHAKGWRLTNRPKSPANKEVILLVDKEPSSPVDKEPNSPVDKEPSSPQMREEKIVPEMSHAKGWRLVNRTRAPMVQISD